MPRPPFQILVLGDFSGRESRGTSADSDALASRRVRTIDRDNYEDVLAAIAPSVVLSWDDGRQVELPFRAMDDFHPDRLYERLEVFSAWRGLRRRLQNPDTFAAAAAELRSLGTIDPKTIDPKTIDPKTIDPKDEPAAPNRSESTSRPASPSAPGSLLRQAVQQTANDAVRDKQDLGAVMNWELFLRQYVNPVSIARPDPQLPDMLAAVDATAAGMLRDVLHHPHFQALESAWRGMEFLVRRVATDTSLKICLLDVSQRELMHDLATHPAATCGLRSQLVDQTADSLGGVPWGLLLGNYDIQPQPQHFAWLQRMAELAQLAKSPLLAAASPALLGCIASVQELHDHLPDTPQPWLPAWRALRDNPALESVGLISPRFLLRRPYGAMTDPITPFPFEEMEPARHESYLWGNPIFAVGYLWAEAVSQDLQPQPGALRDIAELPVHTYDDDGETVMKPCAEVYLTDTTAQQILDRGVMPLISFRNQPQIRCGAFRRVSGKPFGR